MGNPPTIREHKHRGRATAKSAAELSPLEAQSLSLYDGAKSVEQIAAILTETTDQKVTERQVQDALRTGARKQERPRAWRPPRQFRRDCDLTSAARNCHAVMEPKVKAKRVEVEHEDGSVEQRIDVVERNFPEWRGWPFRDHPTRHQQ